MYIELRASEKSSDGEYVENVTVSDPASVPVDCVSFTRRVSPVVTETFVVGNAVALAENEDAGNEAHEPFL